MESIGTQIAGVPHRAVTVRSKAHILRAILVCAGAAVLTVTIPFVENVYLYVMVCVLGACVLVPVWHDWNRGKLDLFAPIHVFGLIYFIDFGLGAIWTVEDPGKVAYDLHLVPFITPALFYCVLGYFALLAGYYFPWLSRPVETQVEEVPRGSKMILIPGVIGLGGYFALAMWTRASWVGASMAGSIASLGQLAPLFLFAWALAWILYFSPEKNDTNERRILFGLFVPGALLVAYLTVSMKGLIVVLAGLPLIARWYARRKLPWASLLAMGFVLVFVIFPFYNTFRWQDVKMSQTERLGATFDTVTSWSSDSYHLWSIGTVKRRMAMINSVAIVVRDVGRWVPYAKGETLFMPTVSYLIPRVLWADKPTTSEGREFGRRFRVTNYFTRNTYIGATIPGELFWNFDLPGVLVGMGLLGLGLRAIYRRYADRPGLDPVRRAIYVVLLSVIVKTEGAIAASFVSVIRTILVFEALRWIGLRAGWLESRALRD